MARRDEEEFRTRYTTAVDGMIAGGQFVAAFDHCPWLDERLDYDDVNNFLNTKGEEVEVGAAASGEPADLRRFAETRLYDYTNWTVPLSTAQAAADLRQAGHKGTDKYARARVSERVVEMLMDGSWKQLIPMNPPRTFILKAYELAYLLL